MATNHTTKTTSIHMTANSAFSGGFLSSIFIDI